jgi:hypothetical protein
MARNTKCLVLINKIEEEEEEEAPTARGVPARGVPTTNRNNTNNTAAD